MSSRKIASKSEGLRVSKNEGLPSTSLRTFFELRKVDILIALFSPCFVFFGGRLFAWSGTKNYIVEGKLVSYPMMCSFGLPILPTGFAQCFNIINQPPKRKKKLVFLILCGFLFFDLKTNFSLTFSLLTFTSYPPLPPLQN